MSFLLYEIQFGDDNYVDELIMNRIMTESVEKVLVLIIQEATKISPAAARSVLRRMAHYKIDHDITKKILSANMDFEVKHGNTATMAEVTVLRQQFLASLEPTTEQLSNPIVAPIAKQVTPVAPPTSPPVVTSTIAVVNPVAPIVKPATPIVKQVTPVAKPATAVVKPVIPVVKKSTPVVKKSTPVVKKSTPVVKKSTPVVKPVTPAGKPTETEIRKEFRRFRGMLLKPMGIYYDEIDDSDVKSIENYTGDEGGLINLCEAALERYKECFIIIKIVCTKYWEREMYVNIRELLAKAKDYCDDKLLKNLIVLYKIKTNILQGNVNEIVKMLVLHIKSATTAQMLNLFEDLANENDTTISKIYEDCLADSSISEENKKLISLEFKVFALKYRNDVINKWADDYVRKYFPFFQAYHCDEQLRKFEDKPVPIKFPSNNHKVANDALRYLTSKGYTFTSCVLVVRLLYMNNYRKLARDYGHICYQKLIVYDKLIAFYFSLLTVMLEAKYGENQLATEWLGLMEETHSKNMNFVCVRADCYIKEKDLESARNLLAPFVGDLNVVMNPEVQKLLFVYSNEWKVKYQVDLLPKILDDLIAK